MAIIEGIVIGISTGIASGIAANILHRRYAYNSKPNLFLCKNIIKNFSAEKEPVLKIKLINRGNNPVNDVKVILYGVNYLDTEKDLKDISKIAEYSIDYLDSEKSNLSNSVSDFIYQISLRNNKDNIHDLIAKHEAIMILIKATDSLHSSTLAEYRELKTDNIIDYNWIFNTGDNDHCTKINGAPPPCPISVKERFIKKDIPHACPLVISENEKEAV